MSRKFRKCFELKWGKGKFCLTKSQQKELAPCELIGEGAWSAACTRPDGKVVKVTVDGIGTSNLIKAQPTKVVPRIYKAYRLKGKMSSRDPDYARPVYALVMEQLTPLEKNAMQGLALNKINDAIYFGRDPQAVDLRRACRGDRACQRFGERILKDMKVLLGVGIRVRDLHLGNVGFDKRGRPKILDLGGNGGFGGDDPVIQRLEELAGRK